MAKQESVKIDIQKGEEANSKIYIMSMNIKGLGVYERAKATKRFVDKETKVLEMVLENDLRDILRSNGIIPLDGSESALNDAFVQLKCQGKEISIIDRYYDLYGEKIIKESENHMTVIEEDGILSCAMEISVHEVW